MISNLNTNDTFDVNWSQANPKLAATAHFLVKNRTNTILDLLVTLTNQTKFSNSLTEARIVDFGLTTSPTLSTASLFQKGTQFKDITTSQSVPSFSNNVCVFSGPTCPGGGKTGINGTSSSQFNSDQFGVELAGDFKNGISINGVDIKFQTNITSYELAGTPVPEPSSPLLETVAFTTLLGAGLVLKRKQKKQKLAIGTIAKV
ncbi:MAG: hypothetical protein NVS2B14_07850 [Chamaesiphon sp.]